MKEWLKEVFKKEKKKTYTDQAPDYSTLAYWVLITSICAYFIVSTISNKKIALPFLLMFPSMIGIFAILFLFPIRALMFLFNEIILRVHLFHVPKNSPAEIVVVIGKNEYLKPAFWTAPNYDMDLLLIVKYLRMVGKPFSIYYEATIELLDQVMANKKIHTVYIVGHGRRHGYRLDSRTVVDYCRYNSSKYKKDFVYQIHCNHGYGTSLVEYVVAKENHPECLPEHGYMSNVSINQMFIDKMIKLKNYSGLRANLFRIWYNLLTMTVPYAVFIVWGFVFFKMVG